MNQIFLGDCGMVRQWDDVQVVTADQSKVVWRHLETLMQQSPSVENSPSDKSCSTGLSSSSKCHATVVKLPNSHLALNGETFEAIRTHHPKELKKVCGMFGLVTLKYHIRKFDNYEPISYPTNQSINQQDGEPSSRSSNQSMIQ